MLTALFVFLAMIVTDVIWTYYIQTIADKKAAQAAFWSMLVMFTGAYTVVHYVADPVMVIPAGLGAAVGTYLTVRYGKKT